MTAAGHVALYSILLGFAVLEVGIVFSQQASLFITEGTGVIMAVGGLLYGARELMSGENEDYEQESSGRNSQKEKGLLANVSATLPSWGLHYRPT